MPNSRLKRFDTSAFTLHHHCGSYAAAVRDCLTANKGFGANLDPNVLDERGWDLAPTCKPLWEAYRSCGLGFFAASDWAHNKCAREADEFRACNPYTEGEERCLALELAMARCAARKINMRMSGEKLPEGA